MRARRAGTLVVVLGLAMGCRPPAETPEQAQTRIDAESAAARTAIDSLSGAFATHFNMGHADVVATYYTEQAHVMAPNQPAAVGRDAIKTAFAAYFPMKPELRLMPDAVSANGPVAVERGTYSLTFTPPGAKAPVTDTGKYLVHWHQVDGKWLIVDDIWNSDLPPIPMGPPAKS